MSAASPTSDSMASAVRSALCFVLVVAFVFVAFARCQS